MWIHNVQAKPSQQKPPAHFLPDWTASTTEAEADADGDD